MKKFFFGMTVDDVALEGWSTPENYVHLIDFFKSESVPATFNIVPLDEATDRPFYTLSDTYVTASKKAYADGFAFGVHGLRHNRFELGVPPSMVLDLPHEAENKRWAAENREFLEKDHSLANCRARIQQGRKVLEDALGFKVNGFRAPALQESPAMFEAVHEEGFLWDSSTALQETGWDYLLDRMDVAPRDITRTRWEQLNQKGYGISLPLTCDYTWMLPKERYELMMELARHDYLQSLAADLPFVALCHVDPVHNGEGIRFLHEFFDFVRKVTAASGRELVFATLDDIAREIFK
ncbi:MAG: polysaccharide deacetylase family protein [Victivallales bacterium]|nr:polysaccharide deacetylase family protein [Victivallales bacterium]